MQTHDPAQKAAERDSIARAMAEFEYRGGKVTAVGNTLAPLKNNSWLEDAAAQKRAGITHADLSPPKKTPTQKAAHRRCTKGATVAKSSQARAARAAHAPRVAAMAASSASRNAIAAALGISAQTVGRIAADHGVTLKEYPRRTTGTGRK